MDAIQVKPSKPYTVSFWGKFPRGAVATVSVVDKHAVSSTFEESLNVYRSSATITIPASYLTIDKLPATFTITVDGQVVTTLQLTPELPTTITKRVTMSLGASRTQNPASALTKWAERIPVKTPRVTTRWRLRVGNRAQLPTAAPVALTQVFTLSDIYLGRPGAPTADGRPAGNWLAAPVKVLSGGLTKNDGSDWVSEWVTEPSLQFGPSDVMQIGLAFSSPLNGNGAAVTSSHYGHRATTAGINAANHTSLSRTGFVGNTLALDKRIEYEFVGDDPVGLLIGASGDEGYNLSVGFDGGGGYEILPHYETWSGVHGQRTRTHWVNAAITGATQTPFLDKNNYNYSRFDLSTTIPDFAVISLGGNAILAGTPLATIKAEVATVINQVRELGIKNIYHATVVPVSAAVGGATDTLRNQYNDWVRTNPFFGVGVIDVDLILRDPAAKNTQLPAFVTSDNIHPNHAGYQRWGMTVPPLR